MAKKAINRPINAILTKPTLSEREKEVAKALLIYGNAKSIARELQITEYAVRYHFSNIRMKMGEDKTFSAVYKVVKYELI